MAGWTPPAPDLLRELVTLLRGYGLDRLYWSAASGWGVLSLPGVTVWCHGPVFTWRDHGTITTWDADDTTGAAERLAALSRASQPSPSNSEKA